MYHAIDTAFAIKFFLLEGFELSCILVPLALAIRHFVKVGGRDGKHYWMYEYPRIQQQQRMRRMQQDIDQMRRIQHMAPRYKGATAQQQSYTEPPRHYSASGHECSDCCGSYQGPSDQWVFTDPQLGQYTDCPECNGAIVCAHCYDGHQLLHVVV